jgi:hypothetical protein
MDTADYYHWSERAQIAREQVDRASTPEEREHAQGCLEHMLGLAITALDAGPRGRALRAALRALRPPRH